MSPRDSETSSSETGSIATGSAGDRDAASAHQVDAGSSSTSTSPSSSSASDIDPALIDEVDLTGLLEGLALGKAHDVRRARQASSPTQIASLILEARNIVVAAGAGISVASGIPDFRSPTTGLYANLQKYNLPHPEAIFDIDFFRSDPQPFYTLSKELYDPSYKPTKTHYFIKLLHSKGLLRRCYTQNIDSLEGRAGVPTDRVIAAHGNFDSAGCIDCGKEVPMGVVGDEIMAGRVVRCEGAACDGLVKPSIVFFGEQLPERFWNSLKPDFEAADLLIVMGSSLVVQPFASLVERTRGGVPRVLINREPVGRWRRVGDEDMDRDYMMLGDCDDMIEALCAELGWDQDLRRLVADDIDRGGTFTDVHCVIHDRAGATATKVMKLLSEDPANYADAPREGIRRFLEAELGVSLPRNEKIPTQSIRSIRMGTTVATNALLERRGERTALVVTKGFRDLLHIANQSRPNIFDLEIRMPENLYEDVVEVDEEVGLPLRNGPLRRSGGVEHDWYEAAAVRSVNLDRESVAVRRPVDVDALKGDLRAVKEKGITSLAVVLKHAALFPDHERLVGDVAKEMGFAQISLSSTVMPMVKMVPRGFTASADAYLTPHILKYIQTFTEGFDAGLTDGTVPLYFMQSDGGLTDVQSFSGHRAILSGPAGGYVGYALTTPAAQTIGFDMGGTSTDVSRYAGAYSHVFESTTAGVTIQAPQLDINTVAAGGGSRLFYESGVFRVGPESAGSHPGPVCYRKNGHLAITDANVVLGRVLPEYFPYIFGKSEDEPLDKEGAVAAMAAIADAVNDNKEGGNGAKRKSVEDVAMGFVKVANEAMCRPIRALTQMRGLDVSKHTLACFGGAGGQHACAIARNLGMKTVYVHRYSGVLSAVGIGLADVCVERQRPVSLDVEWDAADIEAQLDELDAQTHAELTAKGFPKSQIKTSRFLNLRYDGTDVAIMTEQTDDGSQSWSQSFTATYQREFGFLLEDRRIIVDDLRVRAEGKAHGDGNAGELREVIGARGDDGNVAQASPPVAPCATTIAYFEPRGPQPTAVYLIGDLASSSIEGPAIIIDEISTIVVEPGCTARTDACGNVTITLNDVETVKVDEKRQDPVQLAVFSHRFMSIAEQMGRVLQRTSVSVNIKERLDFSCALFDRSGNLVSNAPHLPVHLGAMSEAVKYQIKHAKASGSSLKEGDVVIANHPQLAGGSHLPDITAITPVFDEGELVFFVASRGHHADVGGISPGSMPPNSRSLAEEGIAIISFKVVDGGIFEDKGLREILSHSRNIEDNVSDLRAQIAANNCGIQLVQDLIAEYGLPVVQAYMGFIQENAEVAVRNMLRDFAVKHNGRVQAEDRMDDGTPICLEVTIDETTSSATFDFTGTGPQVFGNTNAPPAVVHSAIIYSLRAMLDKDIPLNHGCMKAVTIVIPEGSLLDPSPDAAVVGGNVLTSQRVTDVILSAFNAAAPSQGCMNNLTFGDDNMGYYETIAGGAGAGPGWNGRSGVHTHMTNTRITDPEILERRYPVAVKSFSLRAGSGGPGRWRGGDGVIRELEFLRPLTVSILSERRCTDVPGLLGGERGARGRNLLVKLDQSRRGTKTISLGGKATVEVAAGDCLRIESPGGGGYGAVEGGEVVARQAAAGDAATVAWMFERHRQASQGDTGKGGFKTGSVREFERKQVEA